MDSQHDISISVVSHGQVALVAHLLGDLRRVCSTRVEVLLTLNFEEHLPFALEEFPFPVRIFANAAPKGFGANHNAAFANASAPYFCVLNPDIRLEADVFPALLAELRRKRMVAAVAPGIVSPEGTPEDSARRFPTLMSILSKAVTGTRGNAEYVNRTTPFTPDWIAGMFMLLRAEVFAELAGFDERYHLYYEDVDLCARLRRRGYEVRVLPSVRAIHAARRESHRNPRYLWWHVQSLTRFLLTTGRRAALARCRVDERSS